jgi:hypothetical protein
MTKQEIFDKVAKHLLTQNEAAIVEPSSFAKLPRCRYRLEKDGKVLKCAIGCLIPDELYHEGLEGPLNGLLGSNGLLPFLDSDHDFLRTLQGIHDDREVVDWKNCLAAVAKNHFLNPTVLDLPLEKEEV